MDLSSYESVKQFCSRASKLDRLDIVTENAGLATPHYQEVEGMESTITVNVISTFLMALLLLPKLRADAIKFNILPRLTIVASDAHEQVLSHPIFEYPVLIETSRQYLESNQHRISSPPSNPQNTNPTDITHPNSSRSS